MKRFKVNFNLDKIGFSASVLCAIHCAFLPILMTLLPLWGISLLMKGWVEYFMIATAVLIAAISLSSSYKLHQKRLPMLLLLIGIVLITVAHLFLPENMEPFVLPAGGLTIAIAHYLNYSYLGKCVHNRSAVPNPVK